ncbi:hypothetical protein [Rhodopseudomonas palustris]|uniref:hypothetical protein n=1 Tax=Rhodopseudomonas sp. BAL398 TaxID=3034676 RepID=UPI00136498F4
MVLKAGRTGRRQGGSSQAAALAGHDQISNATFNQCGVIGHAACATFGIRLRHSVAAGGLL